MQIGQLATQAGVAIDTVRYYERQGLLRLSGQADADRSEVRTLAQQRLTDIEAKLRELEAMRATLSHLVGQCSGQGSLEGCPIIDTLAAFDPNAASD